MKRHTSAAQIAEFDNAGNNPWRWRAKAKQLLLSSRALERAWDKAIQYDPPFPVCALEYLDSFLMLRAMGLECLLKAKALECGFKLAENGRYLPIPGVKQHDLRALAQKIGFEMSEQEARVLKRLSRWIVAGRYPIQRHWSEERRIRPDGLLEYLDVGWDPAWDRPCQSVRKRLAPNLFVRD